MSGPVADLLVEAGADPASATGQAAQIDRASAAHQRLVGARPAWCWFVPGRIEVFGKHTDYAGGRSLVTAVSRGFAVVAGPRPDDVVRVHDARTDQTIEWSAGAAGPGVRGWRNYVAVVARRLAHNFPGAPLGADVVVLSDLPRSAGVSSSSALVVGIASALIRRGDLERRPEWRTSIASTLDLAGYLGAVENGLGFDALVSTSGVGTHGGSEDHTAILASRAGHVSAYSYVPVRRLAEAPMPADWAFVVMTSGVRASKTGAAKARYNRASLGARALFDLWIAANGRTAPTLGALVRSNGGAIDRLRALAADGHGEFDAEYLVKRLGHFIGEDARVLKAIAAFADADRAALGALAEASQHDADALLGNQIDETRRLAALARQEGAFAASSFGAGFGGSLWALVERDAADAFAERWRSAYLEAGRPPGPVESFVTQPGPGRIAIPTTGSA